MSVKFGHPRKQLPPNFDDLYARFLKSESVGRLAKECAGMSESTLRLRLYERYEAEQAAND